MKGVYEIDSKPSELPEYIAAFEEGLRRGRQAKSLFAVDWQEMFCLPLTEVRQRLGREASLDFSGIRSDRLILKSLELDRHSL